MELLRRYPNFRRLWIGEVVSYLGDWFNTIAIYTAVQSMSDSAQAVGAVMVAKTLPAAFVAPIAGPLIDRFDRKKILIWSDVLRALCVVGLVAAYHYSSIIGLFACTVLMMFCSGIVFPTKSATIPMVVPAEHIAAANAMSGGTWSVMLAVGAALGGGATQLLGVTAAFVIDGITFLISIAFFLGLPTLIPPASAASNERATFVDGLRYLRKHRYIGMLASLKPLMALSVGASALMPLIGRWYPQNSGPAFVGLLFAARGAGSLTGSMLLRIVVGDAITTLRRVVFFGYLIAGAGMLFVATASTFAQVVFGFFLASVGTGTIWVNSGTLIQHEGDSTYFGRVFATEFGATTAGVALASWLVSLWVDLGASLYDAAAACGLYVLLPAVLWFIVLRRHERRLSESRA